MRGVNDSKKKKGTNRKLIVLSKVKKYKKKPHAEEQSSNHSSGSQNRERGGNLWEKEKACVGNLSLKANQEKGEVQVKKLPDFHE